MGQIIPQKAFQANYNLKQKYGSYENYKAAMQGSSSSVKPTSTSQPTNDYTMNDVVTVSETGELPKNGVTAQDSYMDEATRIYNEGVAENNDFAASQASNAGAEYREVVRNVNEINKANGRANTGYAGDTSIEAYNAYRNNVNKIYDSANKSNNELYSYYMSEMVRLQGEKDTDTISGISAIYEMNLDENGNITLEGSNKIDNYLIERYGSLSNVPSNIISEISAMTGYSKPDENFDKTQYGDTYYSEIASAQDWEQKSKFLENNKRNYTVEEYNKYKEILDGNTYSKKMNGQLIQGYSGSFDVKNIGGKSFNVYVNDTQYDLKHDGVASCSDELTALYPNVVHEDIVMYKGDLYLYDDGTWYNVAGSDYTDFLNYYKGKL